MRYHVEHIGLAARDAQALAAWYMSVLDAKLVLSDTSPPCMFLLQLPGGVSLELYETEKCPPIQRDNETAGWRHVALRVRSLDHARLELESRGASFDDSPHDAAGGGQALFFPDLEGNLIHLIERPENWGDPPESDRDALQS